MAPFRCLTAAALVAAVAAPAAAVAAQPPATGPRPAARSTVATARAQTPIALAAGVAGRYWGAVPCDGQIKILAQQTVPAGLEADTDAWVTFDSSLGVNDLAAPASSYTRCTIGLARSRWPTSAVMVQDWDMLCMTMTHEFGHLLGHPHDTTPGSVMAPVFTDYSSEPSLCKTTRPRASRR